MQKTIKALRAVQMELNAPKNQFNKFGKYNYRSLEDILEAVKPLLDKNNLTLILSDELTSVDGTFETSNSERVENVGDSGGSDFDSKESTWSKVGYQCVKAIARVIGEDGGMAVDAYAGIDFHKKGMDMSQAVGAASSYARKYALNGLFLIDDVKDADATNDHGNKKVVKSPKTKKKIRLADPSFKLAEGYICKHDEEGDGRSEALYELQQKYDIDAETLKALEELI